MCVCVQQHTKSVSVLQKSAAWIIHRKRRNLHQRGSDITERQWPMCANMCHSGWSTVLPALTLRCLMIAVKLWAGAEQVTLDFWTGNDKVKNSPDKVAQPIFFPLRRFLCVCVCVHVLSVQFTVLYWYKSSSCIAKAWRNNEMEEKRKERHS